MQHYCGEIIRISHGMKVLIATSDDWWLDCCVQVFLKEGCEITAVKNGLQALELLRKSMFDMVLADDSCTLMSPLEFMLNVRDITSNRPLILLGGKGLENLEYVWQRWDVFFGGPKNVLLSTIPAFIAKARTQIRSA